jgi:hypothetical protein
MLRRLSALSGALGNGGSWESRLPNLALQKFKTKLQNCEASLQNMSGFAIARLTEERKNWRKDYPFGFTAKPAKKADNSVDMMRWEVGIPGREGVQLHIP